jgi:small subunit ribosomal protein S18
MDTEALLSFVTDNGKILSRKMTGLSARHQRHVTRMIKRARNMLLMK